MKVMLKVFVSFICMFQAFVLNASEIPKETAIPQIKVKKHSEFLKKQFDGPYNLRSAFDAVTGQTLVLWEEHINGNITLGKILSPIGATTTKRLPTILPPDGAPGHGVTFNPKKKEFLVVRKVNNGISGKRFNSQLNEIGSEFEIVPFINDDRNHHPSVVFNPHTNGYVLAWDRDSGIAAALLDSSGKLTTPIVEIRQNPGENGYYDDWLMNLDRGLPPGAPRILGFAYMQSADKFLLVFQQRFNPTQGDYWLASLDPTLNNFKSSDLARVNTKAVSFIGALGPRSWGASLNVMPDGSALVFYGDGTSMKRRKIDSTGKLSGKAFPAFSGSLINARLYDPSVAFSTISSGTTGLLTARIANFPDPDDPDILYGQAVDSLGRPTGDPVVLDASPTIDTDCVRCGTTNGEPELVALPRKASDKLLRFVYLFPNADLDSQHPDNIAPLFWIEKIDVDLIP